MKRSSLIRHSDGPGWWWPPSDILLVGSIAVLAVVLVVPVEGRDVPLPAGTALLAVVTAVLMGSLALGALLGDGPSTATTSPAPRLQDDRWLRRSALAGWTLLTVATVTLTVPVDLWEFQSDAGMAAVPWAAGVWVWTVVAGVWAVATLPIVPRWWSPLQAAALGARSRRAERRKQATRAALEVHVAAPPVADGARRRPIEWDRRAAWQKSLLNCAVVVMGLAVPFGPLFGWAAFASSPGGEARPGVQTVVEYEGASPVTDCGGSSLHVAFKGAKVDAESVELARAAERECTGDARWSVGMGAFLFLLTVVSLIGLVQMPRHFAMPKPKGEIFL